MIQLQVKTDNPSPILDCGAESTSIRRSQVISNNSYNASKLIWIPNGHNLFICTIHLIELVVETRNTDTVILFFCYQLTMFLCDNFHETRFSMHSVMKQVPS